MVILSSIERVITLYTSQCILTNPSTKMAAMTSDYLTLFWNILSCCMELSDIWQELSNWHTVIYLFKRWFVLFFVLQICKQKRSPYPPIINWLTFLHNAKICFSYYLQLHVVLLHRLYKKPKKQLNIIYSIFILLCGPVDKDDCPRNSVVFISFLP